MVNDTKNPFGGSHQSLIGDLIRDGVTGVAGHVAEPYLNATIRPDILFPAYARGFNLIESFYLAMPSLSWQTVVVGDVLCSPFGASQPQTTDLNPPIDPDTELPAFFSARRVAALRRGRRRAGIGEAAGPSRQPPRRRATGTGPGRRWKKQRRSMAKFAPAQFALASMLRGLTGMGCSHRAIPRGRRC